jgi:transposase
MLHFGNAPVHSTEGVQGSLANFGFRIMERPPYSPDLTLCAFFLFDATKKVFARYHFDTIDDLCMSVEAFLGGLSAEFLQTLFQEWVRRLQPCYEAGGEYVE